MELGNFTWVEKFQSHGTWPSVGTPKREQEERTDLLIKVLILNLRKAADIGAGSGYFSSNGQLVPLKKFMP